MLTIYNTLTQACNLSCAYCLQVSSPLTSYSINYEALDKYPQYEAYKLIFFGGEPLLQLPLLLDISYYLKARNPLVQLGVITNGKLLTVPIVNEFNSLDIAVTISHDGYLTNELRGFDMMLENVETYLQIAKRGISTVVTNKNYDFYQHWEYWETFRDTHRLLQNEIVHLETVTITQELPNDLPIFNSKAYEEMLDKVFSGLLRAMLIKDFESWEFKQYLPWIIRASKNTEGTTTPICGVQEAIHTNPTGTLFSCHNTQETYGSLLENTNKKSYKVPTVCLNCEVQKLCGGGCQLIPTHLKYLYCYTFKAQLTRFMSCLHKFERMSNVNLNK